MGRLSQDYYELVFVQRGLSVSEIALRHHLPKETIESDLREYGFYASNSDSIEEHERTYDHASISGVAGNLITIAPGGVGLADSLTKPANFEPVGTGAAERAAHELASDHTKLHTQGTDQGLDTGGANATTAADVKDAVTKKHANTLDHSNAADHTQGTDQGLDFGGANATNAADVKDAVTKKHANTLDHSNAADHAQGTDQGLDTGGANATTAADVKDAVTKKHANTLDHASTLLGTKSIDETDVGNGKVITYNSVTGNLEYETPSAVGSTFWTVETNFTATPASTSTLTMTSDKTATILVGYGVKYTIGGTVYYGIVTAMAANLLTIAGAPMGGDVTALSWCDPTRIMQVDFFIPGAFADAANTGLLASDARTAFRWGLTKAYLVKINHKVRVDDSGANQPRVSLSVNGNIVGTDNTNKGMAVAETWVSTTVGINTSNYDILHGEAIEVCTDANGTNDDAVDLTVSGIFVVP